MYVCVLNKWKTDYKSKYHFPCIQLFSLLSTHTLNDTNF